MSHVDEWVVHALVIDRVDVYVHVMAIQRLMNDDHHIDDEVIVSQGCIVMYMVALQLLV
jgi:phosphate starvation-inducible membrane PsiE